MTKKQTIYILYLYISSGCDSIMGKKILKLGALTVLLMLALTSASYAACGYNSVGNWTINSSNNCSNTSETIVLNGNLFVQGNLTLNNVTLQINSTTPGEFKINVTGKLIIMGGSNITTNNTSNNYNFYYHRGSTGAINDSVVERLYNASGSNGLYIASSDVPMYNVTILNSSGNGLFVNSSTHTINRSSISVCIGDCLYVVNSTVRMVNGNISSSTSENVFLNISSKVNLTNVTFSQANVSIIGSGSNLTVKWYLDVFVNDTQSGNASATVRIKDVNDTLLSTLSTNSTTGMVTRQTLSSFWKNNATLHNYSAYNVSATNSWGLNWTYVNLTTNKIGGQKIALTLPAAPNSTVTPLNTSLTLPPQGFQVIRVNITNTGGLTDNFTLNATVPTGWSYNFFNNTITNLAANGIKTVEFSILLSANATPSATVVNLTLFSYSDRSSASYNSTVVNVTVSAWARYGVVTQNATDWLELNQSGSIWNSSNYTTAWALWALNTSYGFNVTYVNATLHAFNNSQNAAGYWTDTSYNNNMTTAMVVLAHKMAGHSNTAYSNLTKAVSYLHSRASTSANHTWPSSGPDSYETSIALTGIYKSGLEIANDTNATKWLLANLTNASSPTYNLWNWDSNATKTAWGIWATYLGNANLNNSNRNYRRYAINWLKNNQSIHGYFGSNNSIQDTVMAIIALNSSGTSFTDTWTVDSDINTTTTEDTYTGSLQKAMYWLYTQRNTTSGGWGAPILADSTSQGILSLGDFATITGLVQGTGGAAGVNISGVKVSFGSYVATTNSSGFYSLNLPAGSYAWNVSHTNFTTNSSASNEVLSNGENTTLNIGMLHSITITGAGSVATGGQFLSETSVKASAAFTVRAYVNYSHNMSQAVNLTYYVWMNNTRRSTGWSNATNGYISSSPGAVAPRSSTKYLVNLSVNDSFGARTYAVQNVTVQGTGGGGGTDGGSGGGGGGAGADYGLTFLEYDKKITLAQGEAKTTTIKIKNSGAEPLEDVGLTLVSINSNWYTVTLSNSTGSTEDLSAAEVVSFNVEFVIPSSAEAKTYAGTWRAKDKDGYSLSEKAMNLTITEVWTGTTINTLNSSVAALPAELESLFAELEALRGQGIDVAEFEGELELLNTTIQNAILKFNEGDYSAAQTYVTSAENQITVLKESMAATQPTSALAEFFSDIVVSGTQVLAVIIIIVGGALAGFVIWYKFLRMLPIADVKKNVSLYSTGGARIEGIIKSFTETKKGKVFLIADHTGKMHVRYPYYTTVGKGDLIRAIGVVKTYKDVPYMDATDLHRVTIKHTGM